MKNKMAKILFVLFCILTILNLCCCKTNDKQLSSSASSLQNNDTNSQPTENITPITSLLQTVSASDSLQDIKSIAVLDSSCIAVTTITDVNNMEFLQKYIYSHYRTDKRENWDGWLKDNSVYSMHIITKSFGDYTIYLLKDGSIAIQQMCGDSEVPELTYEIYVADKDDVLTKEKIEKF